MVFGFGMFIETEDRVEAERLASSYLGALLELRGHRPKDTATPKGLGFHSGFLVFQ